MVTREVVTQEVNVRLYAAHHILLDMNGGSARQCLAESRESLAPAGGVSLSPSIATNDQRRTKPTKPTHSDHRPSPNLGFPCTAAVSLSELRKAAVDLPSSGLLDCQSLGEGLRVADHPMLETSSRASSLFNHFAISV